MSLFVAAGLAYVCEGLKEQRKGLVTLVLWNNQLTHNGMGYLAAALVHTHTHTKTIKPVCTLIRCVSNSSGRENSIFSSLLYQRSDQNRALLFVLSSFSLYVFVLGSWISVNFHMCTFYCSSNLPYYGRILGPVITVKKYFNYFSFGNKVNMLRIKSNFLH